MLDQFGRARVADYGITNMKLEPMKKSKRQMRERWMAPEVLCNQERTSRSDLNSKTFFIFKKKRLGQYFGALMFLL